MKRMSEAQAAQWHGPLEEEPAYFKPFRLAAERRAAKMYASGALRGMGHAVVLLAIIVVSVVFKFSSLALIYTGVGWSVFHALNTMWATRRWYLSIRAEKEHVSEVERVRQIKQED